MKRMKRFTYLDDTFIHKFYLDEITLTATCIRIKIIITQTVKYVFSLKFNVK